MNSPATNTKFSKAEPRNAQELTDLVQHTINEIQGTFRQLNDSIMTRIDGMNEQIDQLERNIARTLSQTNAH